MPRVTRRVKPPCKGPRRLDSDSRLQAAIAQAGEHSPGTGEVARFESGSQLQVCWCGREARHLIRTQVYGGSSPFASSRCGRSSNVERRVVAPEVAESNPPVTPMWACSSVRESSRSAPGRSQVRCLSRPPKFGQKLKLPAPAKTRAGGCRTARAHGMPDQFWRDNLDGQVMA